MPGGTTLITMLPFGLEHGVAVPNPCVTILDTLLDSCL